WVTKPSFRRGGNDVRHKSRSRSQVRHIAAAHAIAARSAGADSCPAYPRHGKNARTSLIHSPQGKDVAPWVFKGRPDMSMFHTVEDPNMDDKTRTELEAAVFRRLVEHLRSHPDVQNIDLMNLAGFCRNCLSNWMKEAADAKGLAMSKDESRQIVYGMPYEEWRQKYQKEAPPEQKAAFEKSSPRH